MKNEPPPGLEFVQVCPNLTKKNKEKSLQDSKMDPGFSTFQKSLLVLFESFRAPSVLGTSHITTASKLGKGLALDSEILSQMM